MLITGIQNRKLHALLNKLRIADMKEELVYSFTEQRTGHSSQMTFSEALQLIKSLEQNTEGYDEMDTLRKKVISVMIEMWAVDEKGKADMHFIYWFSLNRIYKTKFNDLKRAQLSKMISILQKKWLPWYYNNKAKRPDFTIKMIRDDKATTSAE